MKLAEQRKTEKERLIKALANHLQAKGISVSLNEETAPVTLPPDRMNPVLEIKGCHLDSIHVTASPSSSCGEITNIFRFNHRIVFDRELSPAILKQIKAKFARARGWNILGGGAANPPSMKWHGKKLADRLNADTGLTEELLRSSGQAENLEIEVYPLNKTTVEIAGPWFRELATFSGRPASGTTPSGNNASYRLETFNRIAGHIRALVEESHISMAVTAA